MDPTNSRPGGKSKNSKKIKRFFSTWAAPFLALLVITMVSLFSYASQLNSIESQENKSNDRIDKEAKEAVDSTYKAITALGTSAAGIMQSSQEVPPEELQSFVVDKTGSSPDKGIVFFSYIALQDSQPTFSEVIPGPNLGNVGMNLKGLKVEAFFDKLDNKFEFASKTGEPQVSSFFRTKQLLSDEEIYSIILFPVYKTKTIPNTEFEREKNTKGYIGIVFSVEGFLSDAQNNSPGFRVLRIINKENKVFAASNQTSNPQNLIYRSSDIPIGSEVLNFQYDNYESRQFNDTGYLKDSLYRNLLIGVVVFLIFSLLIFRVRKSRQLVEMAEKEIRETDMRFSALIQKSTDITLVLDSNGKVIFASPSVQEQLGYTHSEVIGSQALDMVRKFSFKQKVLKTLRTLNENHDVDPFELEVLTKDGEIKIFECAINDLRSDEAIRGIVCNSRDVTDRKEAEQNEMKAKALYENALENTPTGVALVHQDGSCFFCNESLENFLGRDHEDVNFIRIRDFILEEDKFAFSEMWKSLSSKGTEKTSSELRFSHPDGRNRWGLISIRAVYDNDVFQYYVVQVEDTTERRSIAERLEYQAIHDPLTGLPNRLLFVDRLEVALQRSKRTGLGVTVLFLDLDRFKIVNDSLGHAAGDRLLVAVSERIKSSVRPNDTVARFGGDEFVVLCEDISNNRQTDEITKRLLENINRPILLEEGEVYVTASIGIAMSLAGEESPETILRDADTAMYRAKDNGRNRTAIFDERTRARAVANLETGNGMFRALSQDEFRVRYQPIISLASGRLAGFEALVYWLDPVKGHIGPSEFIALAEETGVIVPLGIQIFETACETLHHWHSLSSEASHLKMSINLSTRQLAEPTLYNEVKKVLKKTKVNPDRIWFEITETALMVDAESTIGMLEQLRSLGVHFEVDDFGTGFSSLSYLKKFPLDALKIDQSFIDGLGQDPEDTAIVTAVVSLSHALGLQVIAEGVETPLQMAELKTLGCEYAQGYLFAHANDRDHWDEIVTSRELFSFSEEKL